MLLHFSKWPSESTPAARARLVFLHGMGGTGALWRPIAATLENEYAILAPDQRGHGKSQIPTQSGGRETPQYTPLHYGKDVIETLEAADFHPAWIIGHSMGVRTACAAAHLKPEWVSGLILIDLGLSGPAGGGLGDTLGSFLKILPMEFNSRAEARVYMAENCPDPSIAQYLMAVSVRVPTPEAPDRLAFPFDRAALIQTIHAARDSSVRTWVKELATQGMPILVLRGAQSLVWSKEDFESEKVQFADSPSVHFEEIEGAGHGLPFEKRLEFTHRLTQFMTQNSKA
jgi:pimeloyl-ACP methyl ester carboxylesterase